MATEGGPPAAAVEPRPGPRLEAAEPAATADPPRPPQPLRAWSVLATVAVGYVVLVVALAAIGYELVHADLFAGLRGVDDDVNRWMAQHRVAALDAITGFWTPAVNTVPAVVVAVLLAIRLCLWRRWREVVLVACGLALELSVFLTVNALVDRPRPDVHRLRGRPPNSGFPPRPRAAPR